MKKKLSAVFLALAALAAAAFVFFLCRDAAVFYPWGSAPFYLYVLMRAGQFLLPAALSLIAGLLLRKRG